MNEDDFWTALEFRICRELANMREGRRRELWCDGIYPEHYLLDGSVPLIAGYAWICVSTGSQKKWTFAYFLPRKYNSQADIDWHELFPPERLTEWLALDSADEHVRIIPAAAVPDLA